jgi:Fe-S cluster assembly iron-binding protein IscA
MLTVSEKAAEMLKNFVEKQQGPGAVRLLLQPG